MIWILLCVMALAALMVRSLKRFAENGRSRPVNMNGPAEIRRRAT
jgi:hypothetical protein